jgi:hypothetical protein
VSSDRIISAGNERVDCRRGLQVESLAQFHSLYSGQTQLAAADCILAIVHRLVLRVLSGLAHSFLLPSIT